MSSILKGVMEPPKADISCSNVQPFFVLIMFNTENVQILLCGIPLHHPSRPWLKRNSTLIILRRGKCWGSCYSY